MQIERDKNALVKAMPNAIKYTERGSVFFKLRYRNQVAEFTVVDTGEGIAQENILGVEAPLWSETIVTMDDIEYLAFPRLPGYAEIGWSPEAGRTWEEYKVRLGNHGPRLKVMEVNFYRSPRVPWVE